MNNPNEILEFLKSYFSRNPMVGAQTRIAHIEDLFQCKKINKGYQSLYELALSTYENHSTIDLPREICQHLCKVDETNLNASILLIKLLIDERSFLQAEPMIEKLLQTNPNNQQILELQIQLHKRLKRTEKHIKSLELFLTHYPKENHKRNDLAKLLIKNQPLLAFQTLLDEPQSIDNNTLYIISTLLYQIEEYDLAILFNDRFKKLEPLQQNRLYLGTRIKLIKPEKIYRFFIDQSEIRSYSDVISLTPDQYHFEFEDINNNLFEIFQTLKDGWDYEFHFYDDLKVVQTHFVKTSKFKMKFDMIQQHKEIIKLLKSKFSDLFES
ncbi:MAG: hypothetical protein KC646_10885 [Candidatus Cloacimonetes bacterium]|nr:hypothetical protein [Candidatus Cloacimonadota bacterium]